MTDLCVASKRCSDMFELVKGLHPLQMFKLNNNNSVAAVFSATLHYVNLTPPMLVS